jgi:hypothetical protein
MQLSRIIKASLSVILLAGFGLFANAQAKPAKKSPEKVTTPGATAVQPAPPKTDTGKKAIHPAPAKPEVKPLKPSTAKPKSPGK